jgi:DegV family protein with EDD domain
MDRTIRILTDSVSDLPTALVDRYRIGVLPVYLVLNGEAYLDDGSIDRAWFYRQLAKGTVRFSTAAPALREFHSAYQALADGGADDIIALFTASSVSSIWGHGQVAARSFARARVHVVDSTQISMGLGWQVVEAAAMAEAGATVDEVLSAISEMRSRTRVLGLLDSVDYLYRSGRVGWVTGRLGSLLNLKPILAFESGEAALLGRTRTRGRALEGLVSGLDALDGQMTHLAILHSCESTEMVAELEEAVRSRWPGRKFPVVEIGSVFAAHVGPNCLGLAAINGLESALRSSVLL